MLLRHARCYACHAAIAAIRYAAPLLRYAAFITMSPPSLFAASCDAATPFATL